MHRIVVDTAVRNTWELDATKFNLVNKNWFEDFSSRILRDTAKGLGMFELRVDPHRLLLSEPNPGRSSKPIVEFPIARMDLSRGLVDHLRKHFDGKEQALDWNHWFQELIQDNVSADELDSFCAVFHPTCEEKMQSQTSWNHDQFHFIFQTLTKHRDEEEWILRTFLRKIVPRAERSLLKDLLSFMSSQRGLLYKKFPELYKSTLVHGGQLLGFTVKEVRSYLSKTSRVYWSRAAKHTMTTRSFGS
ncbi:2og-fe oxygenase superfamily [Fusarium pseudoanthophilum]|uniref:2og-fe oxygenase superfamily n=1 Tax=Fusarium pseudoanthophilum TaxID=48495 RepID=A0A8H5PAA5_9HYPO|nr:2og-fe oxygenase superfamily [Fusarium pseudoanthophilum]